ncbi:STAS domain-containing protein [Nonomuraea sp. SBT364]|uniref:STAS domain-containing protein n=1 Tax=Nonomuraea sp. SBT364 TaxID=1580530 RepID=UPI00066A6BC4|nr:STAS domain-containing protein [Nonomuraea sp. SBT364]
MPGKTPLTVDVVSRDATTTRVALSGDLDYDSAPELAELSDGDWRRLDLDLSGVTFVDSSGLAALVRLWQRAGDAGAELRLVAVTPYLRGLLRMTALDRLFGLPPG